MLAVACAGVNLVMAVRASRKMKAIRPPVTCSPWKPVAR
ncbi:Uncharacterised protein [Mycobacterium tuberculosis]|nr:Uncharacterised protein [Mycobacterium tuberculosis]